MVDVLGPLLSAPGALAAAFLDPEGQTISEVGEREWLEVLGAYQSVWLAKLAAAAERSGLGTLSEVTLDFESKKLLAAEVKDGYFILVVFDRDGVPALARAHLPRVREVLAAELG